MFELIAIALACGAWVALLSVRSARAESRRRATLARRLADFTREVGP